ncbi:thylakoid lumenal protein [Haematococcus lacustris]|nr:hypothetical protein QJQ45_005832 [Haematococcus lacustris]
MASMKVTQRSAVARGSSVVCAAGRVEQPHRRALLLSIVLPAVATVRPALALIPDEEDEERVEAAKLNRAKRLAEQRATTRNFMQEEGLTNRQLGQDLLPVQKAVYKLAESGSQLESGDVAAASRTLGQSWVTDFATAAEKVSASPSAEALVSKLTALKTATDSGDVSASKRSYIELVGELQAWAASSSLTNSLKGL